MSESKTPRTDASEKAATTALRKAGFFSAGFCRVLDMQDLELALSESQAELDKQRHLTAQAENLAAMYKAERDESRDECERLRELTYVPGVWRCVKCKLELMASVLAISSGSIHANNKPQECPNGCGPLWRVTERDQRKEAQMLHEKEFLRAEAAEARERELKTDR